MKEEIIFDPKVKNQVDYKGITFTTMYHKPEMPLQLDVINEVRKNFYDHSHESYIEMQKQLMNLLNGNTVMINKIYAYYFEPIANDCKYLALYSINEVLESDILMQIILNKISEKPLVFYSNDITENVRTCFRIGAKPIAGKLSNYPFEQCRELLKRHTTHKRQVYIDPCCGWGVRMLACASLGMDYIGFDVNPKLIVKLNEFGKMIQKYRPNFKFQIIDHGSEVFVPELVNTTDVVFTSPPYYQLEDYGEVKEGAIEIMNISYKEWLKVFVDPMINNMIQYAKPGASIMINIKNLKKYPMFDDFAKSIARQGIDFERQEDDEMFNIKRVMKTENIEEVDFGTDEKIMVFKRRGGDKPDINSFSDLF